METGPLSLENRLLRAAKGQAARSSGLRPATHFAVSAIPPSRDAALSPLQAEPGRPPALEGSTTTGSDMAVGSQSVTEKEEPGGG